MSKQLTTRETTDEERDLPCYMCTVVDGNETYFDSDRHRMCLLCLRKLERIAQATTDSYSGDGFVWRTHDAVFSLSMWAASLGEEEG
jgi:hypothetical protein